jgi:transcriptional/translational regulatory protein YebC/TACO1
LDVDGVVDEDTILEAALEADVEDVESKVNEEEKITSVFVEPASVSNLRDVLAGKGMEIKATLLVYLPKLTVECSDEDFEENMNVIAALEELDDVDSVEHNVDLTDEE